MTKTSSAGFHLRLLAILIDWMILFLPHSLFWFFISLSSSLPEFGFGLFVYLLVWFLPSLALSFLYSSLLTYHFGGTLGKIFTGLTVTDEKGGRLTLKRTIFRQTVGYGFSFTLFGLGFLSVIKDPLKQAWHDKAVGSLVLKTINLWPVGLIILAVFAWLNFMFIWSGVDNFTYGPLLGQFSQVLKSLPN